MQTMRRNWICFECGNAENRGLFSIIPRSRLSRLTKLRNQSLKRKVIALDPTFGVL